MSLFEQSQSLRLMKTGPGLRERLERQTATAHHDAVIVRLRRFRERMERDMKPDSWIDLEAPVVLLLSAVCEALGLDEQERAKLLGAEGVLALVDTLEERIHPIPSPRVPANERQAKALRYVRERGALDLKTYREICPFWSNETLRLDLADLVARRLWLRTATRRASTTCWHREALPIHRGR